MAQLQPAVAAHGAVDPVVQERAAIAAQQLFFALQRETAGDENFATQPSMSDGSGASAANPYTLEVKVSTSFLWWSRTAELGSWFQRLPGLIRSGDWREAFRGYRRMLDGLDLWVSDQLRKTGKGTSDEALGNAHQHHAQLRSGLELIADKHATRLPALFHPDSKIVEGEKTAGRPAVDTIPMNVFFWRDAKDGKVHIFDLTTPGRAHEQVVDGPLTSVTLATFFEEVARYPQGAVRYSLPDGTAGVAATTGKTKWYEWVGYAGLAVAALGLALVTLGASVPATACFAIGAAAGGLSAAGHLVDSSRLGTATTSSVVLDVAQIAASFASLGALNITWRAGGAAALLARSRWFVPLVQTAAAADVVQMVALSDVTFVELTKIQSGPGTPEDKQRAMAVLLTQLAVMGGLTALSVQGARNARALSGQALEIVDQRGANVLRVVGDDAAASHAHVEPATPDVARAATLEREPHVSETQADVHLQTAHVEPATPQLPAAWAKFEASGNDAFRARLKAFRGNDDLRPNHSGGEGRLFVVEERPLALKRWFKSRLADMPTSLSKLREVRADVEANPKLSADIDVVKIHEQSQDWILRDFDRDSVELKLGQEDAQAARARAIEELEALRAQGGLSPMLADLLRKLKKQPPSANCIGRSRRRRSSLSICSDTHAQICRHSTRARAAQVLG